MGLNSHIESYNYLVSNKLSPNSYFKSIIKSLDKDEVPREWRDKQS